MELKAENGTTEHLHGDPADGSYTGVKRIDFATGQFEAGGETYYIEKTLSIERWTELQVLQREAAFGTNFKQTYERLEKMYTLANQMKFADLVVELNDLMRGYVRIEKRQIPILRMCALFFNTKGEDTRYISQGVTDRKIKAWTQEGIAMKDFFAFASVSILPYIDNSQKVSPTTSENGSGQA